MPQEAAEGLGRPSDRPWVRRRRGGQAVPSGQASQPDVDALEVGAQVLLAQHRDVQHLEGAAGSGGVEEPDLGAPELRRWVLTGRQDPGVLDHVDGVPPDLPEQPGAEVVLSLGPVVGDVVGQHRGVLHERRPAGSAP